MLCTELTKVKLENESITAEPLYCRSWQCEVCIPRRLRELKGLAKRGQPTTFITLTVNPRWGGSPDERAKRLVKAWRNIRQQLKRERNIEKLPFLAVFEETKRGEPHLHIICRAPYIPQSWLSQYMGRYMNSPIVDIRRVYDQRGVGKYLAKYLSKGTAGFDGCKRYWRSQDWTVVIDDWDPGDRQVWIIKHGYDSVVREMEQYGLTVAGQVRGGDVAIHWWLGSVSNINPR